MEVRPIMRTFTSTPFVANEPVGDTGTVKEIVPRQVQVRIADGDGPVSQRELIPLTPPAHELLYGPNRDAARTFFAGMLGAIDGKEGVSNLKGFSLSTDVNSFATNMYMSNIESGFVRDTVSRGKESPDDFRHDFQEYANEAPNAGAQNSGWMDLGPDVSRKVMNVITGGPTAGRTDAEEAALTIAHELQHSVTPLKPDVDKRLVWLEEGAAETLAWWPGTVRGMISRAGLPADRDPDPYITRPESHASAVYQRRHKGVLELLDMAGVPMFDESGKPSPAGRDAAHQLLQGEIIDQVPKNLARAIAKHNNVPPEKVEAIREAIVSSDKGDVSAVRALLR